MIERWKHWSRNFFEAKTRPMDNETGKFYMACCMNDKDPNFPPEDLRKTFIYQVLSKRAKFVGLTATGGILTLLAVMSKSPGTAVMYVYALRYAQLREGGALMDMDFFARLFPFGFPAESTLSILWDAQKGDPKKDETFDNLLDNVDLTGLTTL